MLPVQIHLIQPGCFPSQQKTGLYWLSEIPAFGCHVILPFPGQVWEAFAQPTSADAVPGKTPYLTTHRRGFSVTNLTRISLAEAPHSHLGVLVAPTQPAKPAKPAKSPTRSSEESKIETSASCSELAAQSGRVQVVRIRPMAARNVKPSLGIGTNPGAVQAGRAQPSSVHGGTASVLHAWFVPQGGN